MTTPKAILISTLIASMAFLYVSLRPSYSVSLVEDKGYLMVDTRSGESIVCTIFMNEGLGSYKQVCTPVFNDL